MWSWLRRLLPTGDEGGTVEAAKRAAAKGAVEVAAKQAVASAKAQVDAAGDAVVGFAERELATAQQARGDRADFLPAASAEADDAEAAIRRALGAAQASAEASGVVRPKQPAPTIDREAAARAELERLKKLRR